jgi:hypothetical protein
MGGLFNGTSSRVVLVGSGGSPIELLKPTGLGCLVLPSAPRIGESLIWSGVMKIKSMDYRWLVRILARKMGVKIRRRGRLNRRGRNLIKRMLKK